jgi:transcription initiation factor IIE alpha subunit
MVFSNLNTIENDMSSMAAGGGSFTNLNSSLPQTTKSNPSTTNSITTASNEIPLPTYDINDPRAILKALIRFIMRTFYDIPKSLVIEYIFHYERIKQQDLADRLCLDPKLVRSFIQEFKRDKFIIEDHRLESNDGTTGGRRNQDQYYYKIDTTAFINVVKYRLIHMQTYVENLERQQTYKQSNYKCEQCGKDYTEFNVGKLYDPNQDTLICLICGGNVHEEIETKETTITDGQIANMILFNEQMKPLFQILQKIDEIMTKEQQLRSSSEQDFLQQNGNSISSSSSSNHPLSKDLNAIHTHRSHASNVFDRTTNINHDIEIIIEKDDDDHYLPMDIDETSNTDSMLASSRGPGKPGKKSTKSVQSTAEVATQPISAKMKLASKKIPYEPKPLPHWFIRSTVHVDNDEEHRLKNSSLHPTTHSSSISRQLSNQKLVKSTSLNEIKHMLLVHESRRQKTLTLATMEDSLSPPTPIQITKITDSQ